MSRSPSEFGLLLFARFAAQSSIFSAFPWCVQADQITDLLRPWYFFVTTTTNVSSVSYFGTYQFLVLPKHICLCISIRIRYSEKLWRIIRITKLNKSRFRLTDTRYNREKIIKDTSLRQLVHRWSRKCSYPLTKKEIPKSDNESV